jgi:hypothetical protein
MDLRNARSWIPCAAAALGGVAGCGGSGMSTYGMSISAMPASGMSTPGMPMMPMGGTSGGYGAPPAMQPAPMQPATMQPMVAFSVPAAAKSINLGQGVSLAWSSSSATSCSASSSSEIGGAFTGSQPTMGSMTVAPIGTGTVTYTLTCTGAGGTASASTPAVTVNPSILSTLSPTTITTIGSTVDPVEHGGNPYGLVLATATAGLITKGDLIVCNFNDGATNTEGLGSTVVGLHPAAGSMPYRIAQSPSLKGCNAVAAFPDGSVSAAALSANGVPLIAPDGTVNAPFTVGAGGFAQPWGQAYVAASSQQGAALYFSNLSGTINRLSLNGDAQSSATEIVKGFCASGTPGSIFAPSGLTYDPSVDTLYVVDTSSYSVIAIANVSSIGADGVIVNGQCSAVATPPTPEPTFGGPSAAQVRVIAHGGGFVAPISAALLSDGNLVVGNGDINIGGGQTPNLLFEVSPVLPGGFVGQPVQLDSSGTPGALFGIAATVDAQGHEIIYFNDDNTNTVMMLTK